MAAETELQRQVRAALEARQAEQAERQERLDAAAAQIMARSAELKAAKVQRELAAQTALRERTAERQRAEHERLKRQYRSTFRGDDTQFEAVWPTLLATLTAAQPQRRVTPL